MLPAPAGRRSRDRRAADRDEGREGLLRSLRARGRAASPCSRRGISGRTRFASARSARPPSRGRSTRATSSRPTRSSARTASTSAPTATRRTGSSWSALYANPEFADWTTLIPEGATVLDEVAVTRERRSSCAIARTCSRGSRSTASTAGACATWRRRCSAASRGSRYDLDTDTALRDARVAHGPAVAVRARGRAARLEARLAGRCAARHLVVRRPSACTFRRRTARRSRCSSCTARTSSSTAAIRRCSRATAASTSPVEPYYMGGWYPFISRGGVFVDAGVRGGIGIRRDLARAGDVRAQAEHVRRHGRGRRMADRGEVHAAREAGGRRRQQRRPHGRRAASRSAPTSFARRSARSRCSTWCAIHKFLIARYWIAEYGDPDRAEDFRWILRYSPVPERPGRA